MINEFHDEAFDSEALKVFATRFFLKEFYWTWKNFIELSVFSPNAGKYGKEKTPYLDTFRAVYAQPFLNNLIVGESFIITSFIYLDAIISILWISFKDSCLLWYLVFQLFDPKSCEFKLLLQIFATVFQIDLSFTPRFNRNILCFHNLSCSNSVFSD